MAAVLNYTNGSYSPGSFTLTTGTSASDVLALKNAFQQFDPNYFQPTSMSTTHGQSGTATRTPTI